MQIVFSDHAEKQFKNRLSINRKMVLETIANPDEVQQSFRTRQLYRRRYVSQILEVVTVTEHNKIVVITEYFLE